MPGHIYTIEELMLDESFVDYCLSKGTEMPSRWRTIIRENQDHQKTFDEAKRLILALHGGLSRPEVNRQIEIVRRKIGRKKEKPGNTVTKAGPALSAAFVITNKGQIKRRLLKTAAYSAVCMSILITGILLWFFFRGGGDVAGPTSQPLLVQTYYSPLGERKKIDLPDGSFVIINSNSSISIAFTDKKREVHLKGDAFFRVAKDYSKPFTVYSEKIAATALGTEFYMRNRYDGTSNVQVDLLEGKLQIVDAGKNPSVEKIILSPGESGKYGSDLVLKKTSFDTLSLRSWIGGHIVFKNTPLQKAVRELEKWYGIRIEISRPELKNQPIDGDYVDDPLQDILKVLCFSTNSRYSIKDDKVIIE